MEHRVVVEQHAAGPLDAGLDDDSRDLVPMLGQQALQGGFRRLVDRQGGDVLGGHDAGEQPMHAFLGVADGHGGEGVAMIAAAETPGSGYGHGRRG